MNEASGAGAKVNSREGFWSVMVAFVVLNSVAVGLRLWLRIMSTSFG